MPETPPRYVRLAGHGLRAVPRPPFAIERAAGDALEITTLAGDTDSTARVEPRPVAAPEEASFGSLEPGPLLDAWRLEVGGVYAVTWPHGSTLASAPDPEAPPFFLFRAAPGALVYIQGPFEAENAPSEDAVAGTGQREIARGRRGSATWVELAYDHGGEPWRQRHYLRPLAGPPARSISVVVTTQAPEPLADRVHRVADEVSDAIAPYAPAS